MLKNDKRVTLQRALSKMGICSRTEAVVHIESGSVSVNGKVVRNPEAWVSLGIDKIALQGNNLTTVKPVYLMLNKPRGFVTTARDEKNRDTVYDCFSEEDLKCLGKVSPVGRLDKASEGLLLFTNDTVWADSIVSPSTHISKVYHVQINTLFTPEMIAKCLDGVIENGELLKADNVEMIRAGEKNCWIAVTLSEGRNRQIRRMMRALDIEVLRLIRVSIGELQLADLKKGSWRYLDEMDLEHLRSRKLKCNCTF